jgi:uncharacterized protein (DUF302 family)
MTGDGLITIASRHSVRETIDRVAGAVAAKGIAVLARVDHAAGAASVGMPLRPTELIIFGNPRAGTPLMQASQAIGIDLPLKLLAWEDAGGKVWLTWNDPSWLAERHRLADGAGGAVAALATTLAALAEAAAG